jgi:outer membrane receptor protein involved in Fe transport
LDLMNVFNKHYALVVYQNPDAVYSLSHQSAYGKSMTSQFQGPRQFRFGLRWRF